MGRHTKYKSRVHSYLIKLELWNSYPPCLLGNPLTNILIRHTLHSSTNSRILYIVHCHIVNKCIIILPSGCVPQAVAAATSRDNSVPVPMWCISRPPYPQKSQRSIWHSISLKGEKDNIIKLVCMDAWTPVRWVTLLHAVHCTKLSN